MPPDEILRVPGDLRFSAQAANAWTQNENVAAYNNGFAEASIWLEAIAMHRLKNRSHSWFTPLICNNVWNQRRACAGKGCSRCVACDARSRPSVHCCSAGARHQSFPAHIRFSFQAPSHGPWCSTVCELWEGRSSSAQRHHKYRQLTGPAFLMASVINSAAQQVFAA